MQNQERGIALFCLFGECKNLALLGDYCREHQFQRAEAAESRAADEELRAKSWHDLAMTLTDQRDAAYKRNAELEAERDEARRQLTEAQHAIDVLSNTVVSQDATIKQLEQAREDVTEYRAEIARLHKAMTTPPHIQQALNEGDGVYRP